MRVTIIKQASNVRAKLTSFVRKVAEIRDDMQSLAANTLHHAAKHGDCSLLNDFYKALSKGDQASFKRWVVAEVQSVYPADTKTSDLFMGMKQDEFHIKKDTMDKRGEFIARVDALLETDAADSYGMFFAIDPDKTKNPFNTLTLLAQLNNLVKKADKEDSQVDPAASALLKELVAGFQAKTADLVAAATHQTIQ